MITFEEFDEARKLAVIGGADGIYPNYDGEICFGKKRPDGDFSHQVGHIDRDGKYFSDL